MKVTLVHDWLNQMGGAENVLETLVEMFPKAPIYTTIYWKEGMPESYRSWDIRTTWLDRAPGIHRAHQPYLPLYPKAIESIDLSGYDLILSNKSGFCHGVRKQAGQVHICYCLTPTRYVWDYEGYAAREGFGWPINLAMKPTLTWLRRWDRRAAERVDHFVAISTEVQARIRRYYNRESTIIHPPVDTGRFSLNDVPPGDYYLIVSRLIPYKRIDLAIEVCNRLKQRLLIVGEGRHRQALEAIAGPTVSFLGRVPENELRRLVAGCRAFIFPGYEDFGIAPVEAMAAGRPVVAYAAGGALDTVCAGVTGVFFQEQTVEALAAALKQAAAIPFEPERIRAQAQKFSVERFKRELQAFISQRVNLPARQPA